MRPRGGGAYPTHKRVQAAYGTLSPSGFYSDRMRAPNRDQSPVMIVVLTGFGWLVLGMLTGLLLRNWITGILAAVVLWAASAPFIVRAVRNRRARAMAAAEEFITRAPVQIGATADGTPVYSRASTALRPEGVAASGTTNVLAILALIFGLLGGLLAIPFGHIARSQIRRTREGGAGIALAGLILGYLWLAAILVVVALAAVAAIHR